MAQEKTSIPIEWHICSLIVTARPVDLARLSRNISRLPGAEVAIRDPVGKLVVTLEAITEAGIASALRSIESMRGVITAALVFHQVDDPIGTADPRLAAKEPTA